MDKTLTTNAQKPDFKLPEHVNLSDMVALSQRTPSETAYCLNSHHPQPGPLSIHARSVYSFYNEHPMMHLGLSACQEEPILYAALKSTMKPY